MIKIFLTLISIFCISFIFSQGVSINTTGNDPHDAAILDVSSTNKGVLIPRLTTSERDNNVDISSNPVGLLIFNSTKKCFEFYANNIWNSLTFCCGDEVTFSYNVSIVTYGSVLSAGQCWLDRNLGASQVAISSTDANAYGDLFQWGRLDDGHQVKTSGTTTTLSATDVPGHDDFIIGSGFPNYDWRDPNNFNLWIGVNGVNNPCPTGWRLPTSSELNTERLSWAPNNNALGAYSSPLKLTLVGVRLQSDGVVYDEGVSAGYWTSSFSGSNSQSLTLIATDAYMQGSNRAHGFAVRCIKD